MNNVLILGTFDGVHLGHRALFKKARSVSQNGKKPIALLFDRHPSEVLGRKVELLTTAKEKENLIRSCGVDVDYIIFDENIASMEPHDYIKLLCDKYKPMAFVIGRNHTFGKNAAGNVKDLIRYAEKYQYKVHIQPSVMSGNDVVSSTRIRKCILNYDVDDANNMLGGYYSFEGVVEHGRSVGTAMGIPTANVRYPHNKIELPNGVYCVVVNIEGKKYLSVMNVGNKPTFGADLEKTVECFILGGYDGDLYDRVLRVEVVKFIRNEICFNSPELLKKQIFDDVAITIAYAKTHLKGVLY